MEEKGGWGVDVGDSDSVVAPPPAEKQETRRRNTSLLELFRFKGRSSTVERETVPPRFDSYGPVAHGEMLGLSLSLRIPFTQTGAGRTGTMKLFYIIRCSMARSEHAPATTPPKTWEVAKKYSDFVRLDRELREALGKHYHSAEGAYGLVLLPPRHIITSDFDKTVIAERKAGFLQYLQSALTASFFFDNIQPILANFLECPGAPKHHVLKRYDTSADAELDKSPGTALQTTTALGEAHHGFLRKYFGPKEIFRPFRLAFCVLNFNEGVFRYYKASRPVLLGEVLIKNVYGKVQPLEPKQFGIPSNGFGFQVWMPHTELIMYAETAEDRIQWMNAFRSQVSSVIPPALAAMPLYTPRPPTQSVAEYENQGSSLVFAQESRRLSEAKSLSDPSSPRRWSARTDSLESIEPFSMTTDLQLQPQQQHSLVSVQEHEHEREKSSAIQETNNNEGFATETGMAGVAATVGAAIASVTALLWGHEEKTEIPEAKAASTEETNPVTAGNNGATHLDDSLKQSLEKGPDSLEVAPSQLPSRLPRTSSLTLSPERPRFPSNLIIESSRRMHLLSEDSIRPPSEDPESPDRRQTAKSERALVESSSYRKLPPPRFPSNLRIASSGGGEHSMISPANKSRERKKSILRGHRFRLFMTSGTSARGLEITEEDASSGELFMRALNRLKLDSLPTRNPHILLGLFSTPDPWRGRTVELMTPHQFSSCMENVYFDAHSLRKSSAFRPRQSDLIVSGVARSGTTPILFALDSFRLGRLASLEQLPSRVPWIEGKELPGEPTKVQVVAGGGAVSGGRLMKTTLPVRYCLGIAGGQAVNILSPKVVVVLRDPLDLRLSWFRHCRRVYRKCHKKEPNFDDKFNVSDFAQVPIPSCNPTFSAAMAPNETYEVYVREVLQLIAQGKTQGHLHIVFYEELVADCENTIRKLAGFAYPSADEELIRRVVDYIQESPDFPGSYNDHTQRVRIGCIGWGHNVFPRDDVEKIDDDWDRIVRAHFPHFDQYAKIYERYSDTPYPHPRKRPYDENLERRKSSGLGSLLQPGRRSLIDSTVGKLIQKRLSHGNASDAAKTSNQPYYTNGDGPVNIRVPKKVDPDDSDEESETNRRRRL